MNCSRALFLLVLISLAGCLSPSKPAGRAENPADVAFRKLSEEYIRGYLRWRPQVGTALGLHQYDGQITDYSAVSIRRELARLKYFDQELDRLNPRLLSPAVLYDYRILNAAVRTEIFTFEAMQVYWRNPMVYAGAADLNIYIKRNFAPLPARIRSIISIERQIPALLAAARANLEGALAEPFVETAIEIAKGTADFLARDLRRAVTNLADPALLQEFAEANDAAVGEMTRYADYLKTEKLPGAHQDYALGSINFARMLAEGELIQLSPEKVLAIGLRELKREQADFAAAARVIDPAKTPIEVFKTLQRDHPTAENLISDTKKNLEAIRQFLLDRRIVTIPSEVRVAVEETPPFARSTSFASMDSPGPFEAVATEAFYYVTPVEKEWSDQQKEEWLSAFNYYTTDVVSIHEAFPGHYLQFLHLKASEATRVEKIFSSYAFVEGWAHYVEQMMIDEGYGAGGDAVTAAKYRMAQSDEALLRLCRLCVSIQVHCYGMKVDEATRFFQENCYYEPKPARQEAVRATFDPFYLYYTLGKLQILKLREDYRRQEGAAFSLQRFHDAVLDHGMPQIRLLRERLLKDPQLVKAIL